MSLNFYNINDNYIIIFITVKVRFLVFEKYRNIVKILLQLLLG